MKFKFYFSCFLIYFSSFVPIVGQEMCMEFLELEVENPIMITDCATGYVQDLVLGDEPTPLVVCDDVTLESLFLQVHWDATAEYYEVGEEIPCDKVPIPVCARIVAYISDKDGNKLGGVPFLVGNTYDYWTDCRALCRPAQVQLNMKTPSNGYYLFELQLSCCDDSGFGDFKVKKTGLLHFSGAPAFPDVDFDFIASLTVDGLNNQGDVPNDGLEPTSSTIPGPALGDLSIGVDANVVGGAFLESITYTINEVSCITGGNSTVIFEHTEPLATGQQPENFLFLDQFLDPVSGQPWFFENSNTLGKCFELTVTVTNACGSISNASFFTITESCQFCLIDNQDSDQILLQVNDAVSLREAIENENNLTSEKLLVFPNPASDKIVFQKNSSNQNLTNIVIRNSAGIIVERLQVRNRTMIEYNLKNLSNGIYFVEYLDDDGRSQFQKFVKQ